MYRTLFVLILKIIKYSEFIHHTKFQLKTKVGESQEQPRQMPNSTEIVPTSYKSNTPFILPVVPPNPHYGYKYWSYRHMYIVHKLKLGFCQRAFPYICFYKNKDNNNNNNIIGYNRGRGIQYKYKQFITEKEQ